MKRIILLLLLVLLVIGKNYSQVPQKVKYQMVVRDNQGKLISEKTISVLISLLEGTETGKLIYQEKHIVNTNQFGLVNLAIGGGELTAKYQFQDIKWGSNIIFMNIKVDVNGGEDYIDFGTTQLLSVPYSLYSEKSGNALWLEKEQNIYRLTGNIGIGIEKPDDKLDVDGIIHSNNGGIKFPDGTVQITAANSIQNQLIPPYWEQVNLAPLYNIFYNDGNVGIGTTNPLQQLEITRNFRIPNTTSTEGIIYKDNNPFIHNFGTNNTFLGINAGNFTSIGSDNIGIGTSALAMSSLQGSSGNIAIGKQVLMINQGSGNVGLGSSVLLNNIGSNNVGIGAYFVQFDHLKSL